MVIDEVWEQHFPPERVLLVDSEWFGYDLLGASF